MSYVSSDQTKLLDRAREHDRQTQSITAVALGAMVNPMYTDATHATLQDYWGTSDAAIWSGSFLAAESWRLLATGSRAAADEVAYYVNMLDDYFQVTGNVGYLSRLALPRSANVPLEYNWQGQAYCTNTDEHCNVTYRGVAWDWLGGTSRDAYTGTMLGLGMAYLATPDATVRETARKNLTTVALELTKSRVIPMEVSIDGVPLSTQVTLENVILAPSEYVNTEVAIQLQIASLSSFDGDIAGLREFLPDYSVLIKQLIPAITIPIPRPSTAIMLGGFFNIALRASKGVPGYEATYSALKTYYDAHADAWLSLAETWSYDGGCNASYFSNHIAFIMAYVWALLETDPTNENRIANNVVDARMWQALQTHKNSYFAYLWGGTRASATPPDPTAIASANTQLAEFPLAPKAEPAVNHTADYPADATCQDGFGVDESTVAVDVKDRVMDDFIWQRGPWIVEDRRPRQEQPVAAATPTTRRPTGRATPVRPPSPTTTPGPARAGRPS